MMNAEDLDFDHVRPIDLDRASLVLGPGGTPMSTVIWGVATGDMAAAEGQIADDIEWGLMPYNKVLKGKGKVMQWFRAAVGDQKEPVLITNAITQDWGVLEYWNIGTVSQEVIDFGNQQGWPWPRSPETLLGQKYRVAQCFVYHVNADRQIDFMRQYLDAGSVWAQFR